MSEVMRWKLKGFIPGVDGMSKALFQPTVVLAEDYDAAQSELAALREELARTESMRKFFADSAVELDKRLTAAEHWSGTLERAIFRALDDSSEDAGTGAIEITRADYEALAILIGEPTESGESE